MQCQQTSSAPDAVFAIKLSDRKASVITKMNTGRPTVTLEACEYAEKSSNE